ncbi:MAG: hypothetical protein GWN99_07625 [Gemmatimonadetes bacterium]|uniref:DUF4397 domain-containing protein n=1 Tax=Candidatus Kutchimonas denitrificans TaxID=3056748 RepID=A0AAE4Z9P2_9BACT|nr:hypothetical protein [Gemmatimonadota bacterium]NIR75097.1 hypothetical protein [Candidatus Kutchimonas denitrificans]NIS00929.1 hypothetical protein [Gemmatimonadota bacterium]NIT66546.1 hypothetical protein [Gemmatimonadota bacterium]NIU52892.1 hypothetical protein [Gemmatimonadota bacterium]
MRKGTWILATVLTIALGAGLACDGDSTGTNGGNGGPVPGSLIVSLTTPNTDDGAVQLTVSGGTIDGVSLATGTGYRFFSHESSATSFSIIVAGDIAAGPLASISVPDVNAADSYSAALVAVADRSNQIVSPTTGYALTVTTATAQ